MYKFVLKDKGTNNEGWWLEISNINDFIKYLENTSSVICENTFKDYINNKHNKPLTEAIKLYGAKNEMPFLSAYNYFRIGVVSNQIKTLERTGKIFINPVGGYHGAYEGEEEYDYIIKDALSFPNEQDINNIIENSNNNKKEKYGWLSPLGEFIEEEYGRHESMAMKIIVNNKWREERIHSGRATSSDFLVMEKGYVLIHNPSTNNLTITNYNKYTKKQKDFLYNYFIELGMKEKAEYYLKED